MKTTWLHKKNNTSLILFFNGWGMDKHAVAHLDKGGLDICMLNEFNPISTLENLTDDYQEVYLIAWSLGVWAAANCLSKSTIQLTKAIAINGTQKPMDDNFGIPSAIFDHTLKTWNEANRSKFNMRIMGGSRQYELHLDKLSTRTAENQQEELSYIQKLATSKNLKEITFDTALIGTGDLIFNAVNQHKYWQGKSRIVEIDLPHYPFEKFKTWKEIIDL